MHEQKNISKNNNSTVDLMWAEPDDYKFGFVSPAL